MYVSFSHSYSEKNYSHTYIHTYSIKNIYTAKPNRPWVAMTA